MKSANVNYSANETCKSLSVPLLEGAFSFGSAFWGKIWKRAALADDFERFPTGGKPDKATRMSFFRDRDALYLGFFCEEAPEERTYADMSGEESMYQLWSGDLVELHFGSMDPDPWKFQLCIGIGGGRFDSTGKPDAWQAKVFENAEGWGAEVRLPLKLLPLTEGGIRFEFCRQALKRREYSVWSKVRKAFHETENYGELLFADYALIAQLRGGYTGCGRLSRTEFEALRKTWEIPADTLLAPPLLLYPDRDAITMMFQSAGKVAAFAECRRLDAPGEIRRFDCARENGILRHETVHLAHLTGLIPGAEYSVQAYLLKPSSEEPHPVGDPLRFRTLPADSTAFSFLAFSDLHSDILTMEKILQSREAQTADFLFDLGDNLSGGFGRTELNRLLIEPVTRLCPKPLALACGNHEQLGIYADDYYRIFRHPSGRTWYTFCAGAVHFTVLDSGSDHPDSEYPAFFGNDAMRETEIAFEREVIASRAYREAKYRILAVHIPPFYKEVDIMPLLAPMCEAAVKPDLMLSGHTHDYARLGNGVFAESSAPRFHKPEALKPDLPFPLIVNSTNTALLVEVTPETLQITAIQPRGEEKASVKDIFTIKKL